MIYIHHLRSISSPRYMKTYTYTGRSLVDEQSTGPCGWITTYLHDTHLIPPPSSTYILALPDFNSLSNNSLLTSQSPKRKDFEDRHQYSKKKPTRNQTEQTTMCIRTITHWLPCCHQRCTSIGLCPDAILAHSNMTTTTKEEPKLAEKPTTQDETETEAEKKNINPFDCPAGGPVFSDQASKEVCPVCGYEEARDVEGEVGAETEAEVGDDVEAGSGTADSGDMDDESFDGYREAEEAETLAALSWESYFDRHGWIG
jgi:hypothetical protein